MQSKVVDAKEDAKAAEIDDFDFEDVLEEELEYVFVCNGTPSNDDDKVVYNFQDKDHVFNQKDQGSFFHQKYLITRLQFT